ncbi:lactoylglutathione lyase-like lyase [Mycolicibacterium aurum]|uniref:Lactoylglutathione lyase-like lyase n=1 Tax=Mycolicibacterium aurum TaxID=1791 RepID=A0A3S5EJG8_MYCAU|nr:VOC family protein [Mycolicibacterium aurum]VEG55080.1 lactoylglutathione lyase-like lyase [Mycolicibacterium aurum]
MIQGFSHIGICVTDLDRSVRFYTRVFGFALLYQLDFENNEVAATMEQDGKFRSAMLIRDDIRIELLQWVDVPTTGSGVRKPMTELGFTHLSFRVVDVDGLTEDILAAGGTLVETTRTVLGDADDPASGRFIYLTDPDGTRIELMQNVPDLSGISAADIASAAAG